MLILCSHIITMPFHAFVIRLFFLALLLAAVPVGRPVPARQSAPGEDGVTTVSIVTNPNYTPDQLVREVFARGACENISNVNKKGSSAGIGYFENGENAIGLDRGIILATGPISHAHGPNQATDRSGNFNDNAGDPALAQLSGSSVRDVVGLSFDFIPLDSFVTFRYVFASEEYCEFVGSIYNDVFGFFISGPGISGGFSGNARNVALVPGSQDFVSINTVNHLQNTAYYRRNLRQEEANSCNITHQPSPNALRIEYDGFTTPLTATLKLDPCATYHIRFMVADVGDNFYDSAVFLEAGSFNIGGAVQLSTVNAQTEIYEGCPGGAFRFSREPMASTQHPMTVRYKVSPSSTATPGVDFAPFPGVITIPAGQQHADLPVQALNDDIAEGPESIVLELDIPCACYTDSAQLNIIDAPPMSLTLPPIVICHNSQSQVTATASGGIPPYQYHWSNNQSGPTITAADNGTASYGLTVTDACGHSITGSAPVTISTPPTAHLSGFAELCEGDTAQLSVQFTGVPPWHLYYQVDNVPQPAIHHIWAADFRLPAALGGHYELTQFGDAGCGGIASGEAEVRLMSIVAAVESSPPSCHDSEDGSIQVGISGGTPPYNVAWGHAAGSDTLLYGLPADTYTLYLTDARACAKTLPIVLSAPLPILPIAVTCEQIRQPPPLQLSASGGTPPYLYGVGQSPLGPASVLQALTPGQRYELHIQDAAGCETEQSFLMPAAYERMLELPASKEVKLGAVHSITPTLLIPSELLSAMRWVPEENLSCSNCLVPEHTALRSQTYTLRIYDEFGCSEQQSIDIIVDPDIDFFAPTAFSPNGDDINDKFMVLVNDIQVEAVVEMQVFDRWGGLVFVVHDAPPNSPDRGWDGTRNGRPMPVGIYAYMARLRLADGSEKIVSGDVLLKR